jgi:hydroxymethyl cephem carbamoyltransferase
LTDDIDLGHVDDGVGYFGAFLTEDRSMNFLGKEVKFFSTTHERAHIMSAFGLAPVDDPSPREALVWEGAIGSFYVSDDRWRITRELPVLVGPGIRAPGRQPLEGPTTLAVTVALSGRSI